MVDSKLDNPAAQVEVPAVQMVFIMAVLDYNLARVD
jgi:hypothetical protein